MSVNSQYPGDYDELQFKDDMSDFYMADDINISYDAIMKLEGMLGIQIPADPRKNIPTITRVYDLEQVVIDSNIWQKSGTNITLKTSTDAVGIGVSPTGSKLDIYNTDPLFPYTQNIESIFSAAPAGGSAQGLNVITYYTPITGDAYGIIGSATGNATNITGVKGNVISSSLNSIICGLEGFASGGYKAYALYTNVFTPASSGKTYAALHDCTSEQCDTIMGINTNHAPLSSSSYKSSILQFERNYSPTFLLSSAFDTSDYFVLNSYGVGDVFTVRKSNGYMNFNYHVDFNSNVDINSILTVTGNTYVSTIEVDGNIVVPSNLNGIILKDGNSHSWIIKVNTSGVLYTTYLG
jgi:hypothetical protein